MPLRSERSVAILAQVRSVFKLQSVAMSTSICPRIMKSVFQSAERYAVAGRRQKVLFGIGEFSVDICTNRKISKFFVEDVEYLAIVE
mmetsp:Transcript_7759/g.6078  ORF Transcript_7759/g.6078 Transcript_7759/m.6078 type:complete len:87 (+) Transcript_7759:33-293(+)